MDNDWNGLADLIANLITKYAGVLDLDNLPNPTPVKNIEDKKESAKFKAVVNRDDELIRQALSNDKEYHKVEFFPNVIDF